ncbi:MAG: bifunctional [glutamate--ammonia ligase]-adenylyl-L-tyrosine phosphorylase/[glutamate--ammonia-ligase] adenylyltransferase [Pseudomonadota bacterium]|nr:MAG: bifunctional [glutamate--ammonia ligase]-adenylyl-L-tyrosine phosphorylase/[glutamate--ammonia-ligase] adenylyltransferase [Pseudomonadota bacterium]
MAATPQAAILQTALDEMPEALRARVQHHWERWCEVAALGAVGVTLDEAQAAALVRVWSASDFVAQACIGHPALLTELLASGDLARDYPSEEFAARLASLLATAGDEPALHAVLRRLRQREMVRIAWRDIAGLADLQQTTADLSLLAEACIDGALAWLHARLCAELGTPRSRQGDAQQLVVIGMGKLGAWELNFSSDVDLVFFYPEEGETDKAQQPLSNGEFFTRLGKALIQALDKVTADGFVFRVDMRLRPFGDSGPLVLTFDAAEHYYQTHGREWERYAFIKARVVGGDRAAGEHLSAMLQPFVFRRYLDYGAFEALRDMKQLIDREVRRKQLERNIKLGSGGIREVEFIGQAFQLIRGGRDSTLQERRILRILDVLQGQGVLPQFVVRELQEGYVFLRTVEHRLQEFADQQTHVLPNDDLAQLRLAWSMGYADWPAFAAQLAAHRARVQGHFERVFEAPQIEAGEGEALDFEGVWAGSVSDAQADEMLGEAGYGNTQEVRRRLAALRTSRLRKTASAQGRQRLDRLMPLLVAAAAGSEHADITLTRLLDLVEAVARRSVYLALLVENPLALSQLVKLCGASPWIARYLTRHPLLLDELMDPRTLYAPPERDQLAHELRQRMSEVGTDDDEGAMDVLRHFKQTNVLKVAAADLAGALPLMKVSDRLTWIAEAVVDAVLEQAWRHLAGRHGRPVCSADGRVCDKGFAVVAYGKLGGIELGYGSDLDLVFLHGGEDDTLSTDGEKPLAVPVFFARLGQRMIHIFTAHTPAGVLYEVDLRLRPDGASGMMVSSLRAYRAYQKEKAWIWEHQALVRARVVAGDPLIAQQFDVLRREVLGQPRDPEPLRREVREMRERMRSANSRSKAGEFDLKQDYGGIADIEFMVQYGVLAWAAEHPTLLDFPDNIRILEGFAGAGLMPADETALLTDAYRTYRDRLHRLTLQELPGVVPEAEYATQREAVAQLWRNWLGA